MRQCVQGRQEVYPSITIYTVSPKPFSSYPMRALTLTISRENKTAKEECS